eukprot:jgi/Mesvir1/3569/Mv12033-RA.1
MSGIGMGCGFGVGWGVGGSPFSAYGLQAGAGCGVGIGLGWGVGLGFGSQVPNTNTEFIGLDGFQHTQKATKGWVRGPLGWVWSRLQTQRYMEQYLGSDPYVGFKNPGQREAYASARPDGLHQLIGLLFGRSASARYSVEKDKFAGFRKAILDQGQGMLRAPQGGGADASHQKGDDKESRAKG